MTYSGREGNGIFLPSGALFELILEVCSRGAAFRFRAGGHSMKPAIKDGDIVTISPLNGFTPVKGEVIAFKHSQSDSMLIHRVVGLQKGKMVLQGDASEEKDGLVGLEDVAGVVSRVERGGRAIFWPDRFIHPRKARVFYSIFLIFLAGKRKIRKMKMKTIRRIELHSRGKLMLDKMRKIKKKK